MGLLDQLAGQLLGGANNSSGAGASAGLAGQLLPMALQFIQNQPGGIGGLLDSLRSNGMAGEVSSWLGQGSNQPVNGSALGNVLDGEQLGQLANQLGVNKDQALGGLASILPALVDQLSPRGQLEDNNPDLMSQGLAVLGQMLNKKA